MNEIPLQFPFTTAAGQKLEAVTPRRLKVRDLRSINDQAKGDPAQIELLGVARMVNVIPEDLDEMDVADYQKVKERFLEIMGVADKPVVWAGAAGPVVPVSAE